MSKRSTKISRRRIRQKVKHLKQQKLKQHSKQQAEKQQKKEALKAAKIAIAKRKSGKKPGKEPSTSIPVKKAIAKDSRKSSKGQEDVKPKHVHDLTAVITKTVLRQSHQHNPRTYMQGRTAEMEPGQRLILITEITEKKSPHHWELMQKVQ